MAPRNLNYSWYAISAVLLVGLACAVYIGVAFPRPSPVAPWLWFAQAMIAFVAAGYGGRETLRNLAATKTGDTTNREDVVYTRGHLRQDILMVLGFGTWGVLGLVAVYASDKKWYSAFATAAALWALFVFMVNFVFNVTLRRRMRRAREGR